MSLSVIAREEVSKQSQLRGGRDCFACARNDKREGSQLYLKNISNVYKKLMNNYARKIACNIKKIIILHKNLLLSSFN